MSNALAPRNNDLPATDTWQTMLSMAEHFVASGMLPKHITTPAAAVAIIQRGRELGIPPMYALNNIVYIQGKATTNSELMLALIYRDHGDDAITFPATDANRCVIAYRRRSWPAYQQYQFTIDDAKQAGLMSNATWQKYPAAMLRARAISAVARMAFPDTIAGMYLPEELGATVEVDREGGFVIVDDAPHHVDTTTGEIIDAAPATADLNDTSPVQRDIARLVAEAQGCQTKGHLRIIAADAEKIGLLNEPVVFEAMREAKARLIETSQQPELVKA